MSQLQQSLLEEGFIPKTQIWLNPDEHLLFKTASLCPECLRLIPMYVFEKDGRVLLRKTCKTHGTIEDVYWGDAELFKKAKKYEVRGPGIENPARTGKVVCPVDCGLCSLHESHSALVNLVVTNRCDLSCWYCFFYAEAAGYIYEPTLDEIREMVKYLKSQKPRPTNAIQITGGNPELREDVTEIIRIIKEHGIDHVQFNTNGTAKLWRPGEGERFAKALRAAGVNTIYLSFDGVTPRTNPKNHWEIPGILENCRKAGLGIVLVPTVIRTVNDHEVGDILKFGFYHNDIVRGVNYQPVSLTGRMKNKDRIKYRITIPDVIKRIEEQTDGQVPREAFYPVPCTVILSNFFEALMGTPKYKMTINPACGMATYVFKDVDGKMVPITEFVDVEGLFNYLKAKTEELRRGANKYWVMVKTLAKLSSFIDRKKQPKNLNLAKLLFKIFIKQDYKALGELHLKALFIGMMHFQDLYNWDIQRIKKCDIHYVTPDKSRPVIPFCTFNVIPQWYRDKIQKEHSIPLDVWMKRTGINIRKEKYKRNIKALESSPLYKKTYAPFMDKIEACKVRIPALACKTTN